MLRACRTFAGGFSFNKGSHGSFRFRFEIFCFEIYDNLLWLRLFQFHALEIGRGDLERVQQGAGGFAFETLLQDHLHDLANDGLDGVRVFENGQGNFAGCVLFWVVVAIDGQGTILLMVETTTFFAEGGRSALDSADLDVSATRCCKG